MKQPRSLSVLNPNYDDFLFAKVSEEVNGLQLSVLSALARMDVDPWEEATQLAAMPEAVAEKALVSILDLICGKSQIGSENAATAARLVRLLPQPGIVATAAATVAAKAQSPGTSYWWVWLCFGLAMTFATHHQQKPTTPPVGITTSNVKAVSPSKANAAPPTVPLSR